MTKLEKARKFCYEVGELAKTYNLPVFVVTDGASLTRNSGNPAVRFHREKQIEWENQNNFDPNEDWGSSFEAMKSYVRESQTAFSIIPMNNHHITEVLSLMDKATEYHMSISSEFKRYIENEAPNYHDNSLKQLKDKDNKVLIATNINGIIGYIMYRDRGTYTAIRDFYLDPSSRGNGAGTALMDEAIKRSPHKDISLRCLKENKLGYRFYTRYGFKIDKTDTGKKYRITDYVMSYKKNDTVIRRATKADKKIITDFVLKTDEYYMKTCPTFAKNYNKDPEKNREQSRTFVDRINISDFHILELNGEPIGTIMEWDNDGETTLINFYVDETYRGNGYGRLLLDHVINGMKNKYCVLSVYKENEKSLKFYYKYGFKFLQEEETDAGVLYWLRYDK